MNKKQPYAKLFQSHDGTWTYEIYSANGKPLAESAQFYQRRRDAIRGVKRLLGEDSGFGVVFD